MSQPEIIKAPPFMSCMTLPIIPPITPSSIGDVIDWNLPLASECKIEDDGRNGTRHQCPYHNVIIEWTRS